jgi:hypothetical protein
LVEHPLSSGKKKLPRTRSQQTIPSSLMVFQPQGGLMKRTLSFSLIAAAALVLLSGCVPGAQVTQAPEVEPTATQLQVVEPTEESTAPTEGASAPTLTVIPENTSTAEQEAKPTARVGLQATDPETVRLGSGDIQLVEFFAFW